MALRMEQQLDSVKENTASLPFSPNQVIFVCFEDVCRFVMIKSQTEKDRLTTADKRERFF